MKKLLFLTACFCCVIIAQATCVWNGAGSDELASNPDNWVGGLAPVAGDSILLDGTSDKSMTWDLNISIQDWVQDGYEGIVTVTTVYPDQGSFNTFEILNDCIINSGAFTHSSNSTVQKFRLHLSVGRDLVIGENGSIHADKRGFQVNAGPGKAEGAAYGGCGSHSLGGVS